MWVRKSSDSALKARTLSVTRSLCGHVTFQGACVQRLFLANTGAVLTGFEGNPLRGGGGAEEGVQPFFTKQRNIQEPPVENSRVPKTKPAAAFLPKPLALKPYA